MTIDTNARNHAAKSDDRDLYAVIHPVATEDELFMAYEALAGLGWHMMGWTEPDSWPIELWKEDPTGPDGEIIPEIVAQNNIFASYEAHELANLEAFERATALRKHALLTLYGTYTRNIYKRMRRGQSTAPLVRHAEYDGLSVYSNGYDGPLTQPMYRREDLPWVNLDGAPDLSPPPVKESQFSRRLLGPKKPDAGNYVLFFGALGIGLALTFHNPVTIISVLLGLLGFNQFRGELSVEKDRFPTESRYVGSYVPWWTEVVDAPTGKDVGKRLLMFVALPYLPLLFTYLAAGSIMNSGSTPDGLSAITGFFIGPAITAVLITSLSGRIVADERTVKEIKQLSARVGTLPLDVAVRAQQIGEPGIGLNAAVDTFGAENVQSGIEGERLTAHEIATFILSHVPGSFLFNGIRYPGLKAADIDHALLYRDKIALIDTKVWSPGLYSQFSEDICATLSNGQTIISKNIVQYADSRLMRMFAQMKSMKHVKVKSFIIVHNKNTDYPQPLFGHDLYTMEEGMKALGEFLELGKGSAYIDMEVRDVLHSMMK